MLQELQIETVHPNPDQPRKTFHEAKLQDLANSIKENGLLQPIKVRPAGNGTYEIIMGERRWRAHKLIDAKTIRAEIEDVSDQTRDIQAIIENLQRADVDQLEEAHAYQRMIDEYGYTVDELATKLGLKQPWRITERTDLLKLEPEYQHLMKSGNLTPSQAYEMSRLSVRGQKALFEAIKSGNCKDYEQLRNAATGLVEADEQGSIFEDDLPEASAKDVKAANAFESKVNRVADMLRNAIKDNEIEAVKKVDPTRAQTIADLLSAMQGDIKRVELALRRQAIGAMI